MYLPLSHRDQGRRNICTKRRMIFLFKCLCFIMSYHVLVHFISIAPDHKAWNNIDWYSWFGNITTLSFLSPSTHSSPLSTSPLLSSSQSFEHEYQPIPVIIPNLSSYEINVNYLDFQCTIGKDYWCCDEGWLYNQKDSIQRHEHYQRIHNLMEDLFETLVTSHLNPFLTPSQQNHVFLNSFLQII